MRIVFLLRRAWPAAGGIESYGRDLGGELAVRHDVCMLAHRTDDGRILPVIDSLRRWRGFHAPGDQLLPHTTQLRISLPRRVGLLAVTPQFVPGLRRSRHGRVHAAAGRLYARLVGPEVAQRSGQPDVLHVLGGNEIAMAGVRAARLLGVPAVVTPFAHPGHWDDDVASAVAYRQADAVVAATAVDADAYRTLGVSDAKLHVRGPCSRGVDVPVDEGLRQERGINGPLILFLGSRRKHKGVDLLLESAALVRRERQDVTFAFVGPGPPLRTHERMGILDVGRVDDEERDRWLAAADLLCLPSAVESFGLVVLEAWSARTPVLVSDIPALKQLVEGAAGGVAAQRSSRSFAEAIVQLLAQPERLPAMGGAGWARWRSHHTPEANAAWHARLYESLQQHAGRSH